MIQDRDNKNYLGHRYKWVDKIQKAEIITDLSLAREKRKKAKKKEGMKLVIIEFELTERAIL
ncbi:MAG TPA: hypothetical protein V6C58_26130 [Allocoleopsis sp.]|jgi:hypothetical protein